MLVCEGEVCRDVTRLDGPLACTGLEVIAVESAWGDVVLSVGDIEFTTLTIGSDAVGDLDILSSAVLDEVSVDDLLSLGIDDGIADGILPCEVASLGAVDEEGVSGEGHVGARDIEGLGHLLGFGVEDEHLRGDMIVVPTRGYPDLPIVVEL